MKARPTPRWSWFTRDRFCPECTRQFGVDQHWCCDLHRWANQGWYEGEQRFIGR